ncbi:MAG: hypothetical protein ACQETP_05550 [Bacteroidota bacterium]
MRVAEFAYEANCSIEEAITRCGIVNHTAPQERAEVESAPQSEGSQGETAMSNLKRIRARLDRFSTRDTPSLESDALESDALESEALESEALESEALESEALESSKIKEAESAKLRLQRAKLRLQHMQRMVETKRIAEKEKPDATSEEDHAVSEGEASPMEVRDVLSDYDTLLRMGLEAVSEEGGAAEDPDGGPSMFDIAEQSSNQ